MPAAKKTLFVSAIAVGVVMAGWPAAAHGQELEARAFSASPVGTSFIIAGAGRSEGAFILDPAVSIGDVEADVSYVTVGGGYTFDLFGRQARVLAVFPYAWGDISGDVGGVRETVEMEGFVDPRLKFSIGLWGAPALSVEAFGRTERRTAVGASLTIMPPWGQYDGDGVANLGYNRWAFKPEIGVSHPMGPWTLEASAGAWLFTDNDDYHGETREQDPVLTLQTHVGYSFEDRSWLALDATWFSGGQTEVDGVENNDRQDNARFGLTYSRPIGNGQSLKFTYSTGSSTRRGSDFDTFSITWQRVMF